MRVVLRESPKEAANKRYSWGTVRSPSSTERIRMGYTMQARVKPPERIKNPSPRVTQKKALPNKPNTMDGTLASISKLCRTNHPNQLFNAVNSANNITVPKPRGRATPRQTHKSSVVETRIEAMPPWRPASSGSEITNSHLWIIPLSLS